MLNPGADADSIYSFKDMDEQSRANPDAFFAWFLKHEKEYGNEDKKRFDSFDVKQAAFLKSFKDSGVTIPDFIPQKKNEAVSPSLKREAITNVLMQKLQLEFIPYASREFTKLMSTKRNAAANIACLKPYMDALLEMIFLKERKYIIFGSGQFKNLFAAYNEVSENKVIIGKTEKMNLHSFKTSARSVSCTPVTLQYHGKTAAAVIANTFPRRDLPNAYAAMNEYGAWCWKVLTGK